MRGQISERDMPDDMQFNNLKKDQILKAMVINFPGLERRG